MSSQRAIASVGQRFIARLKFMAAAASMIFSRPSKSLIEFLRHKNDVNIQKHL
jgi:hypothetical protein